MVKGIAVVCAVDRGPVVSAVVTDVAAVPGKVTGVAVSTVVTGGTVVVSAVVSGVLV